jgi:type I protein arginine methyltransferase
MEYSISDYGSMIADTVRMDAYTRALQSTVKPGSVVIDLGAGTGIMSLLSCRLGAKKVFAVETGYAIEVARQIARANGLADRIDFIAGPSTTTSLAEPADVIVSDLRGVLPLYKTHIPSIADARTRLLRKGGVLIPKSDTIRAAVVEAEETHRTRIGCWAEHARPFDLTIAQELVANTWWGVQLEASQLLTDGQTVATLEYSTIDQADIATKLSLEVKRVGTAHALCLWFDTALIEGVGFSNAPGQPRTVYGQAFFPLLEPVEVAPGDTVEVAITATLAGGEYVWRWDATIRRGSAVRATARQSTVLAVPLTKRLLETNSEDYVPQLNGDGDALRFGLGLMDGKLSSREIAARVAERFPQRFSQGHDSLEYVIQLVRKYAR